MRRKASRWAGWCLVAGVAAGPGVGAAQAIRVVVDVKPGDTPTIIEPRRDGMMPVAILSTAQFDATTVDPSTVRIGPKGTEAEPVRAMEADVNRDGRQDLMMLIRVEDMDASCSEKIIRLTGKTKAGAAVEGSEAVTTDC